MQKPLSAALISIIDAVAFVAFWSVVGFMLGARSKEWLQLVAVLSFAALLVAWRGYLSVNRIRSNSMSWFSAAKEGFNFGAGCFLFLLIALLSSSALAAGMWYEQVEFGSPKFLIAFAFYVLAPTLICGAIGGLSGVLLFHLNRALIGANNSFKADK